MNEQKLLYLALYSQFKKIYGFNPIPRKEINTKLGKHYLVPKSLREDVMKEMEEMGLIKRENRDSFVIIELNIEDKKDADIFLKKLNL